MDKDDPGAKLTVHHHIPVSILPIIGKALHLLQGVAFKASLFLRYCACAADTIQNGDGYVVMDGSSRIISIFFNRANLGRSFLECSISTCYLCISTYYGREASRHHPTIRDVIAHELSNKEPVSFCIKLVGILVAFPCNLYSFRQII
jgi:hypothetical protein